MVLLSVPDRLSSEGVLVYADQKVKRKKIGRARFFNAKYSVVPVRSSLWSFTSRKKKKIDMHRNSNNTEPVGCCSPTKRAPATATSWRGNFWLDQLRVSLGTSTKISRKQHVWPEPTTTSGVNVKAGVVDHNFSKWNTVIRPSSDFCWLQDNWTLECHLTLEELQSKRFLWFVLLFRLWYGRIINDKNNFTPYASFVGVIFKILAVYLAVICVFHSVTIL